MKRTISLKDIKSPEYIEIIFSTFNEEILMCESEGYSKEVPRLITLLVEFGLTDIKDWFDNLGESDSPPKEEVEMIVLLGQIYLIRLNNIAQKHINDIDMDSIPKQLSENEDIIKYFPNTTFID